MDHSNSNETSEVALETVITNAIKIPGVKVNRAKFLSEFFANEDVDINAVLEVGPIQAECPQEMLSHLANKLILIRTGESSAASFAMGLPGGMAMGLTVPADIAQFFGMSLRLAQELSYLYGAQDMWQSGEVDNEAVRTQLILYCGVMFGGSGASAGVRLLSSQVAKTALKKIPQQTLTKTFWYPIVKQICKALSIKITKNSVAKGVSKALPIVGGLISGSLNFASMLPMAKKLAKTFDEASFGYTESEIIADYEEVGSITEDELPVGGNRYSAIEKTVGGVTNGIKNIGASFSVLQDKAKNRISTLSVTKSGHEDEDVFVKIEKLAKLRDSGAITPEEYETKKAELLARI